MLELNKIYQGDCLEVMKQIDDNSIDLVVTSPPYDNLRDYNGYSLNLAVLRENLFRIIKNGGIVVMVMQDQTKNFKKSLTSFNTCLDFCNNGFNLFETCIYHRYGNEGAWWKKRFRVDHEYIFIFFKGERPKYFNKESLKIPCKHAGKQMTGCATRMKNGDTKDSRKIKINSTKCRGTIWNYLNGGDKETLKRKHPATFPDKLAEDLILCFSEEGDIILDPLCGSGTTCKMAILNKRNYLGIDCSEEYCKIAEARINKAKEERGK